MFKVQLTDKFSKSVLFAIRMLEIRQKNRRGFFKLVKKTVKNNLKLKITSVNWLVSVTTDTFVCVCVHACVSAFVN